MTIAGDLRALTEPNGQRYGGGDSAAVIHGQSIASAAIGGHIAGGDGVGSGGLFAEQNIGAVTVNSILGGGGDGSGFVAARGDLASVKISSSLAGGEGDGSAFVAAGDPLKTFEAGTVSGGSESSRPRISAGKSLGSVTINESASEADLLAGYNLDGVGMVAGAQIGTVKIGTGTGPGNAAGVNIVAGILAGSDGLFGTFDDVVIAGSTEVRSAYAKIVSVIVKGAVSAGSLSSYGILAPNLLSLKIAGSALGLKSGALNDFYQPVAAEIAVVFGEQAGD